MQAVRAGIDSAERFTPPEEEPAAADEPSEDSLFELVARAKADRGAPFEPEALTTLATARNASPATYQRVVQGLKQAGVRMLDLDREVRRAGLRVIQGGPNTDSVQSTVEAGPYFVTDNGMIAWRKETREGPVPQPLCNFAARIVAEEILDDGAERRTVLVIEGELPDKQRLPAVRIAAERFATMTWVTETWGTAAIVFAGQGKRDHLRVALQMLSGDVPRQIVYGHLGWRQVDDRWAYLHHGAGIDRDGAISTVEVDAGVDGLLPYHLPEPPEAAEAIGAVRASLAILDLGPDAITAPVLGGVYRAPLGEAAPIDFSIHLTGPTGVFKSELAALGQAHFGSGFNSRSLPASWSAVRCSCPGPVRGKPGDPVPRAASTIGGRRLDVIHLKAATFTVETDHETIETAQTDQQAAEKSEQNQCCGQFGQFGPKMKQRGPEEHNLRDAVGWEVEI